MGLVNWTRIDAKIHDVSILKPQKKNVIMKNRLPCLIKFKS